MIKKNGGIFGRNPTYNDVVVEGTLTMKEAQVFDNDITINGDLTVNGTETVINTVELNVDDKNITMGAAVAKVGLAASTNITAGQFTVQLAETSGLIPGMTVAKTSGTGAFGASPKIASVDSHTQITLTVAHATSGTIIFDTGGATDDTADGGGITLKGTTDKFIKWVKASVAWVFSDPIKTPDITVDNLTASKPVFTDANKKLTNTGTMPLDQGGTGATTAADARTNLGLGSAATAASTDFAPAAQGVTNGNSHDHNGGDGGQIAYSSLSGLPTLGTIASQNANNVAITGGTVRNISSLSVNVASPASYAHFYNVGGDNFYLDTTGYYNRQTFRSSAITGSMRDVGQIMAYDGYGMWHYSQAGHTYYTNGLGTSIYTFHIGADGNIYAPSGNLVIGTSGKGIDFSATGQATGMTSELLADYEEGTWTAVMTPETSGSFTLYRDGGAYIKVGKLVHATAWITVASGGNNSAVGTYVEITLPITAASTDATYMGGVSAVTRSSTPASRTATTIPSANKVRVYVDASTLTWGGTNDLVFTVTYVANA